MMAAFEMRAARLQQTLASSHFHHWHTPDGEIAALFFRTPEGYLLRFPDRADFTIAPERSMVSCVPVPHISQEIISLLYLNQVFPLVQSNDGELVLHASAAIGRNGALAFLGASGRGKSTLAAGFARAGYPFLTDDGLWLEHDGTIYMAKPNRPGLRLWPDSEEAILDFPRAVAAEDWSKKGNLASGPMLPFQDKPACLRAIYVLGEGLCDDVSIERLDPAMAVLELIKHAFILDVENRPGLRAHFDRIIALAETITCFALDYPRRYEELPRVIDAVLAHANSGDFAA